MSFNTKRTVRKCLRFDTETFLPGANNKFTKGRAIDAGHSVDVEPSFYDYEEKKEDVVYFSDDERKTECESEEESEWDCESEEESEWDCESEEESEEESEWECESEEESEEEKEEEEKLEEEGEDECGYWESDKNPLPEDVYIFNLEDGIWSYYSYVKKIDGEFVVTISDWLDDFPENIYNDDEWRANMVGKLKNVVLPDDRQVNYIKGDFTIEKGWRNVQLPMSIVDV